MKYVERSATCLRARDVRGKEHHSFWLKQVKISQIQKMSVQNPAHEPKIEPNIR